MTTTTDGPAIPVGARERLVGAADRLFYQRGLHAVGINEIVNTAGVAKTSLYLHFSSKDELIANYLSARSDFYEAEWNTLLAETAALDPHARLDAIFRDLRDFIESDGYRGCPFVNAAAELPDASHPGYEAISEYRRYVREELFGAVARAAGLDDPDALAAQLQLLYDGTLAGAVVEGSSAPVERACAVAHTVLNAALGLRRHG